MTGCIGSEDVEFTLMSEHAPETSLFKWKIDGDVEVIEHPFKVSMHIYKLQSSVLIVLAIWGHAQTM